jgi:hypothetical protein
MPEETRTPESDTPVIHKVPALNPRKINQVYFGYQGCACGCGGNYHKTLAMKKRALAALKKHEKDGIEIIEGVDKDKSIVSWEGTKRAIRVYTKEDAFRVKEKMKKVC